MVRTEGYKPNAVYECGCAVRGSVYVCDSCGERELAYEMACKDHAGGKAFTPKATLTIHRECCPAPGDPCESSS
jgi:hypothetical protein